MFLTLLNIYVLKNYVPLNDNFSAQTIKIYRKYLPTMPMDEGLDQLTAVQLIVPVRVVHLGQGQ